jgi:peptidylprolyl isomerase
MSNGVQGDQRATSDESPAPDEVEPAEAEATETEAEATETDADETDADQTAVEPVAEEAQPVKKEPVKKLKLPKDRPLTKSEKRALAKQAAAKRARAARRRQTATYIGALVIVLGIVAVVFVGCVNSSKTSKKPAAGASTSASAGASANASFPPVPAGADPALSKKPTVTAGTGDLSKLNVTTLIAGKGAAVAAGQNVSVNYVGVTYKDGKEFDSSWSRSEAFSFQVGAGNVIPGWDQGLVGVKVGSRVQLDIPSNLAYGDDASGGAPAGPLRFVVDVLSAS